MPRRGWLDSKIDVFPEELAASGMHLDRRREGELITGQVRAVATLMNVTEATARTYLGDEIITGMARRMLFEVVGERPGADLMEALRTVPLPLALALVGDNRRGPGQGDAGTGGERAARPASGRHRYLRHHRRRGVRHERTRARRAGRGRVLVHPGPADAGFSCHARPGPSPASSRQGPECCPRGQGCPCAEVLAAGVRLSWQS